MQNLGTFTKTVTIPANKVKKFENFVRENGLKVKDSFSELFQLLRNKKDTEIPESEAEIFKIINKEIKDYRNGN